MEGKAWGSFPTRRSPLSGLRKRWLSAPEFVPIGWRKLPWSTGGVIPDVGCQYFRRTRGLLEDLCAQNELHVLALPTCRCRPECFAEPLLPGQELGRRRGSIL